MTIITGRAVRFFSVVAAVIGLLACDNKQPANNQPAGKPPPVEAAAAPATAVTPAPPAETAVVETAVIETTVATTPATPTQPALSPSALETLLAPVALYPDGVLAQVLAASAKPQEVLDGGNWLLVNDDLRGAALDNAAAAAGFTAPMIALMQFPDIVDMMCMKMDWTTALGEAFLADEPAVLAAVQSLRKKAAAMGNLQNSPQLKVENQTMNNQDVITITSPDPAVVYVPQYDPVATYSTPASSAPAATTTESDGHSTAALVTTGLLAFGAGILVNEVFGDDDDDYYPDWGYGGPRYYPAPYYPVYGGGFRPSHQYNNSFNNNNVFINTGKNDYWKQFDGKRPRPGIVDRDNDQGKWKGKNTYDGAKLPARKKMAQRTKPSTREITRHRPDTASDRGRQTHLQKPDARKSGQPMANRQQNVFQASRNGGQHERAASQRGKASVQRKNDRAGHGGGQRAGGRKR